MDSDVKNFVSLYRVELMTRAAKDVAAEFVGGGVLFTRSAKGVQLLGAPNVAGDLVHVARAKYRRSITCLPKRGPHQVLDLRRGPSYSYASALF